MGQIQAKLLNTAWLKPEKSSASPSPPPPRPTVHSPPTDLFAMTECLEVNPFTGVRVNMLARVTTPTKAGWQGVSFAKCKWQTNRPWITVGWDGQLPDVCSVSAAADVNVVNGNYVLETAAQSEGTCFDASLLSQFSKWKQLSAARFKANYKRANNSVHVDLSHKVVLNCADPKLEEASSQRQNACMIQLMQTIACNLSAGVKLGLKHRYPTLGTAFQSSHAESGDFAVSQPPVEVVTSTFRSALLAHYVRDKHQVSGQFKPMTRAVRLAYYYHHNDALQTSVTVKKRGPSTPVVRLSVRTLTDNSVLLTTVGSDGVSVMLEKRLNDWMHVYGSFYCGRNDYGIGFGTSVKIAE